jgi:hypothetical protein
MLEFKKGQKLFFRNTGTTYIVVSTTDFKNISIKREGWLGGFYLLVSKKYIQERYNEGIISIVKERKMFNEHGNI